MGRVTDCVRWRNSVLHALQLLAQASARMRYGVPEPVLWGAAAVELYTGGLWRATEIDLLAPEARPLYGELMAVGFCWTTRPDGSRCMWHPKMRIGINVIDDDGVLGPPARANILTVVIERDVGTLLGSASQSVRVIGIEDLIVDQAKSWLGEGARPGEAATRIDVLVGLGRAGVGGQFRPLYLQRRLACATQHAVTLGGLPTIGGFNEAAQRMLPLSVMAKILTGWRARCGITIDAGGPDNASPSGRLATQSIGDPNEMMGRAGQQPARAANVISLAEGLRRSPLRPQPQDGAQDR